MANTRKDSIKSRQVAVLAANGVDDNVMNAMIKSLRAQGAVCKIIAPKLGEITGVSGQKIKVDQSFLIAASVCFDAVYVAGGQDSVHALIGEPDALHFVEEAYKHCKPIASDDSEFLDYTYIANILNTEGYDAVGDGVILKNGKANMANLFIDAMKQHRFWKREQENMIPA
jgi:catalase